MSLTVQAPHATPRRSLGATTQKPVVHLGQMPAATYAALPPKMQKACRIMVENGEMTIESMPSQSAGAQKNGIRSIGH